MDWAPVEAGLKAWVAAMSGIDPAQIAWDSEAFGQRIYPQVDLRLFDHRARDGVAAEVIYPEPDPDDGQIHPVVEAQRACSWSITITTRDQRANYKAYVPLDALAVLLELPQSIDFLAGLGLAVLDMGRVIPNTDVPSDHRELSRATLTLQLGYVTTVSVPDGIDTAGIDIIEHAEIGGTAIDVTVPITIAPEIMPPL